MDRLTGWDGDRAYLSGLPSFELPVNCERIICKAVERLAEYEDTGLEPEEVAYCLGAPMSVKDAKAQYAERKKSYDEYMAWKKAESEGRLLILPCTVGDTVYRICHEYKKGNPFIRAVTFNQNNFWRIVFGGEFGKTVFLTRAEAEAALRGGADG